ncbi:MAG: DNA double-strand break repair nuclease NurA [Promethearchaeota archaeon]|nr:MAG: DNA double-strand break repair nuclease NurA [Candidatus Lokiarchaeota archaeon]
MTIRPNFLKGDSQECENSYTTNYSKYFGLTKEQILLRNLKNIARECVAIEQQKKALEEIIIKNMSDLNFSHLISYPKFNIKESHLKKNTSSSDISGLNIVSVDGSCVSKNLMNIDFSFLKAIAVQYHFYKNHAARIDYFPDLNGFNYYSVQGNYLNREENLVENKIMIDMNYMEINLLNNMIENSNGVNIDLIIIDGSIVIMPINLLFGQDPELSRKYDRLLKEYNRLYVNCMENGIILIGSIKDTRTSALCHALRDSIHLLKPNDLVLNDFSRIDYRQIFDFFSDIELFHRILNKSERSCIFNCKRDLEKIRDTGIKKEIPYYFPLSFYAFYLKTTKNDTPCRIEFFMDEKHSLEEATRRANLISSILLPISSLNDHYGLPIPQIEAHKRAVFKPEEINLLFNNLKRTLTNHGVRLLEKRRNRRPF